MVRILLVEDDPDIGLALTMLLRTRSHETRHARDGYAALREAYDFRPELLVLDIGLPGLDGWEVLSRVRDLSDVPVLLLTAAGREEDKVRGLRSGADDYLTKPSSNNELIARVDALLRRAGDSSWMEADAALPGLRLSASRRTVTVEDREVSVTPLEFRLLSVLLRHAGQVLTTAQLLDLVWEDTTGFGQERVKFAVMRLRRKLGWDDPATSPLKAVRGVGYLLDEPR